MLFLGNSIGLRYIKIYKNHVYEVFCSKYQTDHPFEPCLISLYFTSCSKSADLAYKALKKEKKEGAELTYF